ncbi:MAG: phosphate signaling complex protein PhoU [Thermoproteota archaeon]|jgi:phosphate transport system protein|nr:phosphate signaling complex protein PhoU [Thermoproteota archaeon]
MRLIDEGLQKLNSKITRMAMLSRETVELAVRAYLKNEKLTEKIFHNSETLRILQDEVSELAVDLIARYQPVASDLRYIKSCMEIAYGFSRFGRYAYDIMQVLEVFGDLSKCDHTKIIKASEIVNRMIDLSIEAFINRDLNKAEQVEKMDDDVDNIYESHLTSLIKEKSNNLNCAVSATLILRYLERIADHASYIAEAVLYIVKGERRPRK